MKGAGLAERTFWIFDMDGTLTVPAHDFAGFKAEHGLAPDADILGAIAQMEPARRAHMLEVVRVWEDEIARAAVAQDDAVRLLEGLAARGARLAVLTRNSLEGAAATLAASGLDRFFPDPALVLGRDCAPAKPEPDGVELVLTRAGAVASDAVMVGDWVYDVMAGRRAGTASVLVERHGPSPAAWADWADVIVTELDTLLDW